MRTFAETVSDAKAWKAIMIYRCPTGKALKLPDHIAGKRFRCPVCKEVHEAPPLEEVAEVPDPIEEAEAPVADEESY